MEHTKLQWSYEKTEKTPNNLDILINSRKDGNGECVAWAYREANAAFIVKAVNNHDQLIDMLKNILYSGLLIGPTLLHQKVRDDVYEAIKQAEDEQ